MVCVDHRSGLWNMLAVHLDPKVATLPPLEIVRLFFGTDCPDLRVVKNNRWFFNFFIGRTWRVGRHFVAGDASHQWPPIGSVQGNTGVASAYNLAWKLTACVQGWGGPKLLDSYEAERRPAILRRAFWVLGNVPRPWLIYRSVMIATHWFPLLWPLLRMKWFYLNGSPSNNNHNCQPGLLCGTRYDLSPVVMGADGAADRGERMIHDPTSAHVPKVEAGARLPNLVFPDGTSVARLLDPARGFTLFVVGSERDSRALAAARDLVEAFAAIKAPVRLVHIHADALEDPTLRGTHVDIAHIYARHALILVRPDRFIAYSLTRRRLDDARDLDAAPRAKQQAHAAAVVDRVTGLGPPRRRQDRALAQARRVPHQALLARALPAQIHTLQRHPLPGADQGGSRHHHQKRPRHLHRRYQTFQFPDPRVFRLSWHSCLHRTP